jgi:hypothetical protein
MIYCATATRLLISFFALLLFCLLTHARSFGVVVRQARILICAFARPGLLGCCCIFIASSLLHSWTLVINIFYQRLLFIMLL